MGTAVSIRSAQLGFERFEIPSHPDRTHNRARDLASNPELLMAETRCLRDNLTKIGRFALKCLTDAAADLAMARFWP
jgi:hypothetical protein